MFSTMSLPPSRLAALAVIEDPFLTFSKSRRNLLAGGLARSLNETPLPQFCFILKHTSRIHAGRRRASDNLLS
jgi:hypothetical protein